MEWLSLTDLYLVGIALEISGAVILARGLFISPREIAGMVELFPGPDLTEAKDRCENRVDSEFGLALLAIGFLLQGGGYVAELAGAETAAGGCRVPVALASAFASAGLGWAVWGVFRGRRVRVLVAGVQMDLERRAAERGEN